MQFDHEKFNKFCERGFCRGKGDAQDYQDAIDAAEDMDSFGEARRLEQIGYDGWRRGQGK